MNTWCFACFTVWFLQWSSELLLLIYFRFRKHEHGWRRKTKQNVMWHIVISIWCESSRPLLPQHHIHAHTDRYMQIIRNGNEWHNVIFSPFFTINKFTITNKLRHSHVSYEHVSSAVKLYIGDSNNNVLCFCW